MCIWRLGMISEVVPVINKIDLPAAEPDKVKKEIEDIIGLPGQKMPFFFVPETGIGIEDVLEAIVQNPRSPL